VASYPAVIELRVDGITQVTRVLDTIAKLDNALVSIKKTPLAIDSGKATDGIRVLKKEVDSFVISLGNGTKQLATTTAGLNSQAAAFRNLAANAKIGGQAFKLYTQAAEQARQKSSLTGGLAEIEAQAQLYKVGKTAPTQAFKGVDELIKFGSQIPKNTASLQLYKAELERVLTVIEFGTQDYRNLERAIAAVNKQMDIGQGMGSKFGPAAPGKAKGKSAVVTGIGAGLGKAIRGSLSSAAIGGAFPLLFGQSPQAALGGAIGGLLGGQAGGFAGSLVGTALGEIEATKARIKELSLELGLSARQAKVLGEAFQLAGRNSAQLEAAVTNIQGLGLSTTETASAIKIAVELSKEYGGSVEKIAQAFANTLESGKVSISTLNKFTAQGIPIQEELADKLKVSRSKLLEMARDGQISVQQVTDALVSMGIEAESTADKGKTGFDRFTAAVAGIASAIAGAAGAILKNLIPALDTVLTKLAAIITRATTALSLIADAQIGEASAALFRSGTSRGIFKGFAQSKGNIDDLTQGLQTLKPLLATNRDELDKFQAVADRYTKELQQYGGQVGEYAVGTAQVELTRVKRDIATRERALGAVKPTPTGIENINAPANISGADGKARQKGKTDAERLAEQIAKQKAAASETLAVEKGRLLVAQTADPLQRRITEAIVQQNEIQRQYSDRLKESKSAEETLNLQLAQRTALQTNALELQRALSEETDKITNPLKELTDASAERLQLENRYQELLSQGINPELAKESAQLELAAEKQTQLLTLRLAELEGARAKLKAEDDVAKKLQVQIDNIKEILKLQGQAVAKSKAESEKERKERQERERREQDAEEQAERLKNLYRGVVNTIEDGIVDAIQVGIDGLINGTKELDQALKEIAAGVLQDIGRQLVRFGVNTLMRGVFPGAFANGGVFAANGIQPFASGGIVNKPTLFPFAEGGTTRTGLMGEAGPEAIMPLRRNSDGRLGVDASGLRSAMGAAPGSAGGSPVLNMSFETTNIGGVEYVSRDQLEAAMAATRRQAASDGAKRGMNMTLDRLQQSPRTRSRVGLG